MENDGFWKAVGGAVLLALGWIIGRPKQKADVGKSEAETRKLTAEEKTDLYHNLDEAYKTIQQLRMEVDAMTEKLKAAEKTIKNLTIKLTVAGTLTGFKKEN